MDYFLRHYPIPHEMNGRLLKLIHGFGFRREDSKEKREEIIDATLDRLYRLGYGGIVTNVDNDLYLESEANWESLRYVVRSAKRIGFRVWLYDEKGYPSGGAGGLTLRQHPEFEALALVEVRAEGCEPGGTVSIALPAGHEYFIEDGNVTLAEDGKAVSAKADGEGVARAYAVKRLYEGTHAEHNVCECRRYINVLDPGATKAFIDNTYEAYRRNLGDLFGEIEAIFTDEPSIMAAYLNAGLYPRSVLDQYDDTLPLLPLVVWDRHLPEKYEAKWGEALLPRLSDLFGSKTDENAQTRCRFFATTSEMYENAYFKQLGDWCENAGLSFSGHVLLEEEILHHPLFEGNIFRFVQHMGVPGIDMLTTMPDGVLRQAPTPKLISSAAHWQGKTEVMSEVSAHMQGAFGQKYGLKEIKGAIALQRALGVTIFPSYYIDSTVPEEEFRTVNEFAGNLCRVLDSAALSSASWFNMMRRTLLVYPIEAAFASSFGSGAQLGAREHSEDERRLEASWQRLNRKLLLSGIEYEIVDTRALLEEAHIENGRVIDRFGRSYMGVVMPFMNYETDELRELVRRLNGAGALLVRDEEGTEDSADEVIRLLGSGLARKDVLPAGEFSVRRDDVDSAVGNESEFSVGGAGNGESPVIISSFIDTRCFRLAFLVVNYTDSELSGVLKLNIPSWAGVDAEAHAIIIDPDNGIFTKCNGSFASCERAACGVPAPGCRGDLSFSFGVNIRPMGALVVGFN